jgi:hypothetical protein
MSRQAARCIIPQGGCLGVLPGSVQLPLHHPAVSSSSTQLWCAVLNHTAAPPPPPTHTHEHPCVSALLPDTTQGVPGSSAAPAACACCLWPRTPCSQSQQAPTPQAAQHHAHPPMQQQMMSNPHTGVTLLAP